MIEARLKRLKTIFWFGMMNLFPMPGKKRYFFFQLGGGNLAVPQTEKKGLFIGRNVRFDTLYPQNITLGRRVHITANCTLLTHRLDTSQPGVQWVQNNIVIEEGAFIGTGTIICADVHIGKWAIVGAGSVVTKDIPAYEIWAGNPARFIKKRMI